MSADFTVASMYRPRMISVMAIHDFMLGVGISLFFDFLQVAIFVAEFWVYLGVRMKSDLMLRSASNTPLALLSAMAIPMANSAGMCSAVFRNGFFCSACEVKK